MEPYTLLIGLSLAVLLSYGFDRAARLTKVPSVLLLLLAGIALRQAVLHWHAAVVVPAVLLPLFGIVGLIFIVLQGSLDLQLSPEKGPLIRRALLAAAVILVGQVGVLAGLLRHYLGAGWQSCLVNAVPLAVVSSAIVIPSVAGLGGEKQEFLTYECTFSDIVGILLFNFAGQADFGQLGSVVTFAGGVVAVGGVAVGGSALLVWLLGRLHGRLKFFFLLAVLVLLYSLAKKLHLSSLVLVLAFGLAANNAGRLARHPRLFRLFRPDQLAADLPLLKSLTAESAFLIRTFFFLLFGFSLTLTDLLSRPLLLQGALVVGVLTGIRFIGLRYVARTALIPELFIAPKGLISVLLFYSIPPHLLLSPVSQNLLFVVILLSGLLLMVGLQFSMRNEE